MVAVRAWADIFTLCRIHQWVKNVFVLCGVVFAAAWHDSELLLNAVTATFAFCLAASSVYVLNDIIDIEKDRAHPTKRSRPLASGRMTKEGAFFLHFAIFPAALGFAYLASPKVLIAVSAYMALQVAYSLYLKHVVILDVFSISMGFMIRLLAGTVAIGIPLSKWMLLCGFTLTLFLGFVKRRAELRLAPESSRRVLAGYPRVFLDKMISISAGAAIMAYALYAVSPETVQTHQTENMIFTVPFVVYGIARYLLLLHQDTQYGEDTARDVLRDKHLIGAVVLWLITMIALIR